MQGHNGVAAVDQKHQIVVDAQAFGGGSEQHTLQPVLETLQKRYQRLGIQEDLYGSDAIVTADTGFANEANLQYLYENNINGYIPDNQSAIIDFLKIRNNKIHDEIKKVG